MAFAQKVCRVSFFGDMFSGQEEWSTGFYLGATGADSSDPNDDFMQVLLDAWETFFEHGDAYISFRFRTLGVKAATMNTDGTTDLDSVKTVHYPAPILGANVEKAFPPQIALVAQLAAAIPRGLGSKGRMFLPGVTRGMDANGLVEPVATQDIADVLAAFFNTITASIETPGQLINASKGRIGIGGTAPINVEVAKVRIGSVYDTQRRRRNAMNETYSEANV